MSFVMGAGCGRPARRRPSDDDLAGVPTQVALMLREPDFDAYDLDSVRFLVVGGGPITPAWRERRDRFRPWRRAIRARKGIGPGTAPRPRGGCHRQRRPAAPAIELGVLDDDDRPVPTGDIGQVCLRSPAVMSGYWRNTDATRA
jgi:acyl-CoA synthetase (AMP-forming)/AMP-acid ligase II